MKKMILAAAAVASLIGAAGAATTASAHPGPGWGHGHGGYHMGYGHGGYRGGFGRYGYRGVGFRRFERGGYWPRGYGFEVVDPYVYGGYRAPYGYEWVRDDYGQLVLIAIGTGVIADVIVR